MTLYTIQKKLRKANIKNYILYLFCNFVAMTLITAYTAMMMSPTVLNVLPEGGDSRKQMMAVFALACVGCIVFTIYGAGLFFRMKSKEIGTLMALGASKKRMASYVLTETAVLGSTSALAGAVCGIPFAALIWQGFRLFIVDSKEMRLIFDYSCLFISVIFMAVIVLAAFLMGLKYLRNTNIMEVVHEEHLNEAMPELGRWCGPVGFILLLTGAVCGYFAPAIYQNIFYAYPPAWLSLLYLPVFAGIYMILLHTVVHGFGKKRNQYKGIISRSMMKFQGKQTVNNMMVVTVLIAGACFGLFYIPMSVSGQYMGLNERGYDYFYHAQADQSLPDEAEVSQMAAEYGISLQDWIEAEYINLALDADEQIEDGNDKFHIEHVTLSGEGKFLRASDYERLTGEDIDLENGQYYAISNKEETGLYYLYMDSTLLTNIVTDKTLQVQCKGLLHFILFTDTAGGFYVLNDEDYEKISAGLTDEWKGNLTCFRPEGEDSYEFASALFHRLVDGFDSKYEMPSYYNRVQKISNDRQGKVYWGDTENMTKLSFEESDSSVFKQFWKYMPQFLIMDQNDLLKNYAVFFMMFLFIAIVCIVAAMIICYTRCMTIAINNAYVFRDLKRLGAKPAFLKKEVRSQAKKVFAVPCTVGMAIMGLLYSMIMFANDGRLTHNEQVGLWACGAMLLILAAIIFTVYKKTVGKMERSLV